MEFGIAIIIILGVLVSCGIFLLLYSALLLFTASISNIEERSFGKALFSTLAGFFASLVVGFFLGLIPFIGLAMSFLASIFIPVLITQAIFNTTLVKALVAEILRFAIVSLITMIMAFITIAVVGLGALQTGLSEALQEYGFTILYFF
jgi:hypothetical protein